MEKEVKKKKKKNSLTSIFEITDDFFTFFFFFVLTCSISVTSTGLLSYRFFCRFVQVVLHAQSLPRVVL